ncbi:hypothetical protein BMH32_08315 [Leucobacter sp. OLJS4]|nr:hypothetical protein BMH25_10480 [Leucobacter sp. OLCALW19]PII87552.1 hypothetical protein BMH26_10335 [Leucobacter sp. OLTLW20]PII94675.1 hypothetical protein BMH27_00065 [Leucobacter sp. OLAS13]PIJ00811.1 hypothetical protein BMH29_01450 [Leucobacter sp. OLDS2]PIJ00839.1 hypothetical protein BMH28_08780 [Leucobacter sp. OLCS4]PIJ03607.1 hypothetical protein BMH31_08030 [Leucobacter sp. OLIS6]PIJ10741.1 hypothetical protein BMH32_08315 [Leucobacter sp. OLJS4]PIJ53557.1 hypothetical prote
MTDDRALEIIAALIKPEASENEVVEFKSNHLEPQEIGEYISALANAAVILGRKYAYLIFGIEDKTKKVIGTTFDPESKAAGNQALVPWLHALLSDQAHFEFREVDFDGTKLVLLIIQAANTMPVTFKKDGWCRVKSHKKRLADHPAIAKELWRSLDDTPIELGAASEAISGEEVLARLSYATYFDLRGIPESTDEEEILSELAKGSMITPAEVTGWYVTTMGALLLAREIEDFPSVSRKSVRLIKYGGESKAANAKELRGVKGYAVGFEGLVATAGSWLPSDESFEGGIRRNIPMVTPRVMRELIANALIHQDLAVQGAGPMVEIYDDRVEVGNPGESLVEPDRIIGSAPKSRNEKFAFAARSMGMCDERGSGWDLIGDFIEAQGLPAPLIESNGGSMRVTVWWQRAFSDYTKDEALNALFFHALVQNAKKKRVTNASVKERFGLPDKDGGKTSKLLGSAVAAGLIKIYDEDAGFKSRSYVPYFVSSK